ncbi:Uncharacterised protein [uncultured archaeon]|nr:Uncharacterised protein [uncultured archaeon]
MLPEIEVICDQKLINWHCQSKYVLVEMEYDANDKIMES